VKLLAVVVEIVCFIHELNFYTHSDNGCGQRPFFYRIRNLVRVHMMNPRCSKFECLLLACRTGETFWRPSRWIAIILYVYGSFGDGRTVLVQGFSFSYQWPRKLFGTCTLPLIFLSGRIVRTNLYVQICSVHYIEILKALNTNSRFNGRSRWTWGLRCMSTTPWLLGLQICVPLRARFFVCCGLLCAV